jgi:alpha-mannosidase
MTPDPPRTFVVVSHTHWDREWYQPFEEFRARLVRMMDSLLDLLERDPEYRHFVLDGQTVPVDDYLRSG